jgi:hypothetical protein
LVILAASAGAQAFGRFGYTDEPVALGMKVSKAGFSTDFALADKLTYDQPSRAWRAGTTSDTEQVIDLDHRDQSPWKLKISLLAPGISLYCPQGLRLHASTAGSPYLTWQEGSVGDGVPTPNRRWLALSFQNGQPPLMFGFVDHAASMKISGHAGDWTIQFSDLNGWLRIGSLTGTKPLTANSASTLGTLAQIAGPQANLFTDAAPKLVSQTIDSDLSSVTATWTFDRPNALVPMAAILSDLGGYPVKILSKVRIVDAATEEGPEQFVEGKTLTVRFPVHRVPTGRGLAVGAVEADPISTAAPTDIPSVVELALQNLLACRDRQTRVTGQATLDEYFSQANYSPEPWTNQQLPYDEKGTGIDLAAAQALLMQALTSASKTTSEANSLLTSVAWRRDWYTWRAWVKDPFVSRRAGALAAVAGALCTEPDRRLEAAMQQAGLAAERGWAIWRRHRGDTGGPDSLIEPLFGVRQALFGLKGAQDPGAEFVAQILSPVRVYGESAVALNDDSGRFFLQWPVLEAKPSMLTLAAAYPLDVAKGKDLAHFEVVQAFGLTELHYIPEIAGDCTAQLILPLWAKRLPRAVPAPTYSETAR